MKKFSSFSDIRRWAGDALASYDPTQYGEGVEIDDLVEAVAVAVRDHPDFAYGRQFDTDAEDIDAVLDAAFPNNHPDPEAAYVALPGYVLLAQNIASKCIGADGAIGELRRGLYDVASATDDATAKKIYALIDGLPEITRRLGEIESDAIKIVEEQEAE